MERRAESATDRASKLTRADNPDPVIVCDTREQAPLVFTRLRSVRGPLTTGDYGILGAEHAAVIERKSVDDLAACCGFERERFERELMRMRGYPFRRLVVVGARADIEAGRYRSQMKPRAVLASLSAFEVRYDLSIYYFPDPAAAAFQVESWLWWTAREIRNRADNLLKAGSLATIAPEFLP